MLLFSLTVAAALVAQTPKAEAKPGRGAREARPAAKSKAGVPSATPEEALRIFFMAMLLKDEPTLRAVTLPTKDIDWLLRGQALPAAQTEEARAHFAEQPIRRLKAGDELTLPGKRKVTVQPDEVSADRAVLLPEGDPFPHRVRKLEGHWRVDATPVIAARKAADAARKKAARPKG